MSLGERQEDFGRLHVALERLAGVDPKLAQLVDLSFFCGFSFSELAELRGVSERTILREWRKARLLLHRSIVDERRMMARAGLRK